MRSSSKLDLAPFVQHNIDVELKPSESPEERASRLRREEAEANMKLWKEKCLFVIGLSAALIVAGLCLWASLDLSFAPEQQKWAMATLTSIITGVGGYLFGKGTK